MSRGVYVALSGAVAQERALETTAENLANASTNGYQRMRPIFKEALSKATNNKPALRFTEVAATAVDQSRGALKTTGRALDVALPEGNYLAVTTPSGERYTRDGALAMDASGILRAAGQPLSNEDGKPIQLSPSAGQPTIGTDGSVWQAGAVVGKLKIMRGDTGTTFSHEAGSLMAASGPMIAGKPTQTDANAVDVGVIEESNATPVTAMTDLVTASRTFEAFQKMLDTFGDCDRKVLTTTAGASES